VLTTPSLAQYRCPACQSIDWFRDGCVIDEADARLGLRCGRVQRADPALAGDPWSCNQCALEVPAGSGLAGALDGVRQGTCDQPRGGEGVGVA
jgi:hypothetical protein